MKRIFICLLFLSLTLISNAEEKGRYSELFGKDHKAVTGMFTVHLVGGDVYFEIPLDLLGREMLLGSTIASTSDNGNGVTGSKPNDPIHFILSDESDYVAMRLVQTKQITSDEDLASGAIFRLFKKECYTADSSAVVVDVTTLFLSDDKILSPFDKYSLNNRSGKNERTETFIKDRSFIGDVKAFSDNVSVRSTLSYKYTISGRGLAYKDVPFTATVVRSILLLDSIPYPPRITDSRIAIFPTEKLVFSDKYQGSKKTYYANRWRLEPSDEEAYLRGEAVAPKKPIIFYIDPAFPTKWKPYIYEGVEQWNELFLKIGFKDAVRALDFPVDDPEFDPDNLKYSCIRYVPISIQNAMGPSWLDPRSGEIINASVYIYHDVIELINNWLFVQTSPADPRVRHSHIDDAVIGDALRYVLSHEVGHCLGFMHNMSASANVPVDSLRSASYTRKYGSTTSIMDYARFNYVAQPEDSAKGLKLTPPRFGEYDEFLVRWNYTPTFTDTPEKDYRITSGWISDALADPVLRYGKQQSEILDPRSQTEDLGDDAVRASEYGVKNLKYVMRHLNSWLESEDADYSYRRIIYGEIVSQYSRYLGHVYNNIGGINLYERFEGDPGENYVCVSADYQKKALDFLLAELDNLSWLDDREVLKNFPRKELSSRIVGDYIMEMLMAAPSRTELCAMKSDDPFTPQQCMDMIFDAVWKPLADGEKIDAAKMRQQEYFVEKMCGDLGVEYGKTGKKSLAQTVVAGYDEPSPIYYENKMLKSDNFGYLLRVEKILKKGSRNKDRRVGDHCSALLLNLQKALR